MAREIIRCERAIQLFIAVLSVSGLTSCLENDVDDTTQGEDQRCGQANYFCYNVEWDNMKCDDVSYNDNATRVVINQRFVNLSGNQFVFHNRTGEKLDGEVPCQPFLGWQGRNDGWVEQNYGGDLFIVEDPDNPGTYDSDTNIYVYTQIEDDPANPHEDQTILLGFTIIPFNRICLFVGSIQELYGSIGPNDPDRTDAALRWVIVHEFAHVFLGETHSTVWGNVFNEYAPSKNDPMLYEEGSPEPFETNQRGAIWVNRCQVWDRRHSAFVETPDACNSPAEVQEVVESHSAN